MRIGTMSSAIWSRSRHLAALLSLVAVCADEPAAEPTDPVLLPDRPQCAGAALLAQFRGAPELVRPVWPASGEGPSGLRAFRIAGSELALDGLRYSLLQHLPSRQAWLLRSGGLDGAWHWRGPVNLADAPLQGCAPDALVLAVLNARPS